MTNKAHQNPALYDNPELYKVASGLRQHKEALWVLDLLPDRQFRSCLDIGCGNGDFLGQLVSMGRVVNRIMGIDRSEEMVKAARRNLTPFSGILKFDLEQADVLLPPKIRSRFDLIAMMAVLHWLYPDEKKVLSWVAGLLERGGVLCLTSYHPEVDDNFYGGSDEVVIEAMKRIGGPSKFPQDFLPIGRRTRKSENLEKILNSFFLIENIHMRTAKLRVTESSQFSDYHLATFGSYYSRILPIELRPRFHKTIGEVAMENMRNRGFVTKMEVRLWVCLSKP